MPFCSSFHSAKIRLTNEQQNLVEDAFKRFGPIPRICIDFFQDRSNPTGSRAAALQITPESLRRFVISCTNLDHDADGEWDARKIFMIRRNDVDDLEKTYVEPISANVRMQ